MAKEKLNITLQPKTIEALKVQAVLEKRSVSEIIEETAWNYLNRFEDFRKLMETKKK